MPKLRREIGEEMWGLRRKLRDQPRAGSRSEMPNRKIKPMTQLYTAPVHAIT